MLEMLLNLLRQRGDVGVAVEGEMHVEFSEGCIRLMHIDLEPKIGGYPPFICIVRQISNGVTCYLDGPSTFVHKGW